MKKRITSIVLVLMLCIQSTAFASFNDIDSSADYAKAVEILNTLNILSGKGDGIFDPDGYVTRAEMAKISTVIADLDVQDSDSSLFSDMEEGDWANGYVNTVALKGIITGYPDGTFQPERNLTYAEAITIVLRLLGYGTKELGNNYPKAYLQKAKDLSLTDGLNFYYGDYINRKSIAILIDNALMTDINSSSKKVKLIANMDYSVSDECIIIATNNESKELLSDEVVTSIGTYKKLNDNVENYVTQTCKLILDKDKKIVSVLPIQKKCNTYIIQSVTGNEVSSDKENVKMDDSSVVYFKNKKTSFSAISDEIKTGTKMTVYYSSNGAYDYAVLTEYDLQGPIIYSSESDLNSFQYDSNGLRVIRDGNESNKGLLQKNDVLYYDKSANIIYSYCDKVSGIYEKAYPNKANVTSIKLSGVTYKLETREAVKSLGEDSDSYKIDDYVTALLGKDGKIAAIVKPEKVGVTTEYGVLLSCSERIEDGTKNYYAKFLSGTGVEQEFKVSMNYDADRGKVAEYNFENGFLMPFFIDNNKISGSIDKQNRKIGSYWLNSDCKIIDLSYAPGKVYEYGDVVETKTYDDDDLKEFPDAVAKVIEISEITATSLDETDIVDAQLDDSGNVAFLVLNDITMSRYKFGIVTDADKYSTSATYKIDFGWNNSSYSIDEAPKPDKGDAVMADIQNNKLLEIRKLVQVTEKGEYESIDKNKVRVGTTNYSLAKDAVIFMKVTDDRYDVVSVDDLSNYKVSKMELYIDKGLTNGGLVRVIIFTAKQ